jgi:hypothetical protein
MATIKSEKNPSSPGVALPEPFNQDEETQEPLLMPGRVKKPPDLRERQILVEAGHAAGVRHRDAQEPVPFPILPGTRLKKTPEHAGLADISQALQ